MRKDVKKEYLDEVIDPKHLQLNKQYLEDRIKEIWFECPMRMFETYLMI